MRERLADFLLGLGVGLIIGSLPFVPGRRAAPESHVIEAARKLGMVFPEELPLLESRPRWAAEPAEGWFVPGAGPAREGAEEVPLDWERRPLVGPAWRPGSDGR